MTTPNRDTLTDAAARLALIVAAVVLVVLTDAPAEPAWLLLGALVPTPRLGTRTRAPEPSTDPADRHRYTYPPTEG